MRQLDDLHAMLAEYRFSLANEASLHMQVFAAMRDQRLAFRHEVHLSATDRIDFVVDMMGVWRDVPPPLKEPWTTIGIEIKIGGSLAGLTRQAHRYLQFAEIGALLVVTSRSSHNRLPAEMNGKPVRVLHLLGSSF